MHMQVLSTHGQRLTQRVTRCKRNTYPATPPLPSNHPTTQTPRTPYNRDNRQGVSRCVGKSGVMGCDLVEARVGDRVRNNCYTCKCYACKCYAVSTSTTATATATASQPKPYFGSMDSNSQGDDPRSSLLGIFRSCRSRRSPPYPPQTE